MAGNHDLAGRSALVTGATSGIGAGIARALASRGCNVMLNGFGEAGAISAQCQELAGLAGARVLHDGADMAEPAQVRGLVRAAEAAFGAVDILVNNAGIQHTDPVEAFPAERWEALIAVNLSAPFHAVKAALPGMRARGWGRIVSTASANGLKGAPRKAAYCAAKHGVIGLMKAVALETARDGITCNAICPGWVLTGVSAPQIEAIAARDGISVAAAERVLLADQPSKRFITAAQIGGLVAFLCSDAASQITGAALSIDGGILAE